MDIKPPPTSVWQHRITTRSSSRSLELGSPRSLRADIQRVLFARLSDRVAPVPYSKTSRAASFFRGKDRARVAARTHLVAGFGSWLPGSDSPRKGSLNVRDISGQNSRST